MHSARDRVPARVLSVLTALLALSLGHPRFDEEHEQLLLIAQIDFAGVEVADDQLPSALRDSGREIERFQRVAGEAVERADAQSSARSRNGVDQNRLLSRSARVRLLRDVHDAVSEALRDFATDALLFRVGDHPIPSAVAAV